MKSKNTLVEEARPSSENGPNTFNIVLLTFWADLAGLTLSLFITLWLRLGIWSSAVESNYIIAVVLSLTIFLYLAFSEKLYTVSSLRASYTSFYRIAKITVIMFGVLLVVAFVTKSTSDFSRIWGVAWAGTFLLYAAFSRLYVARRLRRVLSKQVVGYNNVLIVGTGGRAEEVKLQLEENTDLGCHVVGFVGLHGDDSTKVNTRKLFLGTTSDLPQLIDNHSVTQVFIALPESAMPEIQSTIQAAMQRAVEVYYAPYTISKIFPKAVFERFGSYSYVVLATKPIDRWQGFAKRALDIFLCCIGIIVFFPIFAITYISIKIESKGPAVFVQNRFGFNGEIVKIFKFRSMYHSQEDLQARQQTTKNDPRVTKVGKIIRKLSIDELPQILNVLLGNMSLVGPRPHAIESKAQGRYFGDVVSEYASRHRVKPGITGWAQINGWRGETDTEEKILKRVEHDLYYIQNWSFYLDLYIITKTAFVLFFDNKNAY